MTEHPEIAIAIGRHFGDKSPEKKFYLFELNIPIIDLVAYTDHAIEAPLMVEMIKQRNPDFKIEIGLDGRYTLYEHDDAVESFVSWKINSSEIVGRTQPDIAESSFQGKVTDNLVGK